MEQAIYIGDHGRDRLTITACAIAAGSSQEQWIVRFVRRSATSQQLDQCAAWLPRQGQWDRFRWNPINTHLIPPAALASVESWLREQCAEVAANSPLLMRCKYGTEPV
jgi:hypothetical protein